ncbi:Short-chain dehydrogenase [Alteromonadaceae bacterium Bs31]|nr:Short-chain dehydrogenase [Alteromonadaceae bacterium Bs31]
MNKLQHKWALVTGASRGVGLRVAKALAQEGCQLIVHSRKLDNTREVVAKLSDMGTKVYPVAAELESTGELENLIQQVRDISGNHLDILFNNAAIMTPWRELFEPTIEDYARSYLVNSIIPAKLCDAFLPAMLERDWGRIVNVTSGIADQPNLMAYSCSKAALDRYVRDMLPTLAGTNVLMNLLDPGWLRTDLGGPEADNHPDSVIPGALVPILCDKNEGSGHLYQAQDYAENEPFARG